MANCRYTLIIGKKAVEYASYEELFKVIINNKHKIEYGNINDIVFSSDPQTELTSKIQGLKQSTKNIKLSYEGVDSITEEQLFKSNDSYISVSDMMKNPDNNLNNPFNTEEYKTVEVDKLVESGVPRENAIAQIDAKIQHFENVALRAQQIKSIASLYFAGLTNAKAIMNKIEESDKYGWSFDVYSNIVYQLDEVARRIRDTHGNDCKIIPNVGVTSSLNGVDQRLIGNIDLVVVDSKGTPNIYVLKNSEKTSIEWDAVREQDTDYRLAIYRQMLASNGINVKDTGLYVIPIHIDLEEGTDNLKGIFVENFKDRLTPNREGINRLTWGAGNFYNTINTFIPVTITNDLISSDIRDKVMDYLHKAFLVDTLKNSRSTVSYENLLNRVHESTDYSKGKWMYSDEITHKSVFIKEESPKESNTELRESLTDYASRLAKNSETMANRVIASIPKIIDGETLVSGEDTTDKRSLRQKLVKYCGDNWEVIDVQKLRDLGIVGILNKETQQVDFISITYEGGLNSQMRKLGFGTTILGLFETDREALADKQTLMATHGNIELMKILFALNEMPELFNGVFKVGDIKVINPYTGESTLAYQDQLLTNFNKITKHLNITNHLAESIEFVDKFEVFQQNFLSTFSEINKPTAAINSIYSDLEVNPVDRINRTKYLKHIIDSLERAYPKLLTDPKVIQENKTNPIVNLYMNGWMTYNQLKGDPFYQTLTLEKFNPASGTKLTPPSMISDYNLRTAATWMTNAMASYNDQFNRFREDFQFNYVKGILWKDKGYSQAKENITGSQNFLYDNMFVKDPSTGKVNLNLIVKNPWTDNSLSPGEKKYLKRWLYEMNKERYPNDFQNIKDENSPLVQKILEAKEKSFWVTPVAATKSARWSQSGIAGVISQRVRDFKDTGKYFQRVYEGLDTTTPEVLESMSRIRNNQSELYQFFDPIEISERGESDRLNYISSQDFNYWSRNLEDVLLSFKSAKIRKREYDELLPKLRALRMAATFYGDETGIDMNNFVDWLESQTKIAIHSQAILNDESRKAAGVLKMARYMTSALLLGFNPRGLFRESFEGVWKTVGRSIAPAFGNDQFTLEDVAYARAMLTKDIPEYVGNVTIVEKLNEMGRFANLDVNALVERLRTNRSGMLNISEKFMFFNNTYPDYRNRMTMVVAQLHHDGIWEALSVKEDKLIYDWKKDKRFDVLASGNTNNPLYNKQKGLYLMLLNDINEEYNTNLKFGDDLPRMYTRSEINALKDFADRTFGFYDHETKIQEEKSFMGLLFMQFQTYLTATKSTWLMKPGSYNMGIREQAIDPKSGKLLWIKEDSNNFGEPIYLPTTENTGIPFYINKDSYHEGLWFTLKEMVSSLKSGKFKENIWTDPIRRSNFNLMMYNLAVAIFVMGISRWLLKIWKENWKEGKIGEPPTYSNAVLEASGTFFEKAYLGSIGDINILSTIGDTFGSTEPAAISTFSRLIDNTSRTIFGDMKVSTYLKNNVGAVRSTSALWDNMQDVYKFGEVKVKELSE